MKRPFSRPVAMLALWVLCSPFVEAQTHYGAEARDLRQALRRLPTTRVRTADRRSAGRSVNQPTVAGIRVRQHIVAGRRHAARSASDAARTSYLAALRELAAARVHAQVAPLATKSLAASFTALREVRDFYAPASVIELDPYAMAVTHQSPVLKGDREVGLSSHAAIVRYAAFASGQLATACGHEPLAADALHGLGQVYAARATREQIPDSLMSQFAKVFFSAALRVNPKHPRSGNELGVVLARSGAWEQALVVFRQSAVNAPHAATWHNLAVVHQLRGEREMAVLAQGEVSRVSEIAVAGVAPRHLSWLDANDPGHVMIHGRP